MTPASNSAAGTTPHSRAQNRRRGNRHRLNVPATLVAEGDNPSPIEVSVTELSVGGVGIQSKTELTIGGAYQVNSFDTIIPPGMKVHIVSQRQRSEGMYEIGAKVI